jgi:hypothetical protein
MTENNPPKTETERIVGRVTATARTFVDDSATVLREESKKIDGESYQVADAVTTVARLINVGINGATSLGRIALEERPPANALALGDYVAGVVRRMVSQAGTVAAAAAIDLEKRKYTPNKWLESVTRMIDISIAGGLEIAETIAAGPAQFERPAVESDEFTVAAQAGEQTPEFAQGNGLKRDATDDDVTADRITFDPPKLAAGATTFRFRVDPNGLASGVYRGTVKIGNDTVPVYIAL